MNFAHIKITIVQTNTTKHTKFSIYLHGTRKKKNTILHTPQIHVAQLRYGDPYSVNNAFQQEYGQQQKQFSNDLDVIGGFHQQPLYEQQVCFSR